MNIINQIVRSQMPDEKEIKLNKGFTLVELLVVIAIMSILTVVTVSQFQTARKKARDVQRKADISALAKALEMYYTDYGMFPLARGGALEVTARAEDSNGILINWGGEFADQSGYVYMKVMPRENYLDATAPYCYAVSGDRKSFGIFTTLENEEDTDYNKLSSNPEESYSCNGNPNYHFAILSPNADLETVNAGH